MLWLEILAPSLTYVGGAVVAYRKRYATLYRAWRRWQAEGPNKDVRWVDDYDVVRKTRKEVSYRKYVWNFQPKDRTPAEILALLWPIYWVAKGANKILHPEIKIPDYEKIKELEDL